MVHSLPVSLDSVKQTVSIHGDWLLSACSKFQSLTHGPFALSNTINTLPVFDSKQIFGVRDRYDVWIYREGCIMSVRDLEVRKEFIASSFLDNILSIDYILEGGCDLKLGDHELINNNMPRIHVGSHLQGSQQTRIHSAGDTIRSVGLWISPTMLIKEFGLNKCDFPSTIQPLISLEKQSSTTLPMTARIKNTLYDIIDNSFSGVMAEQFLNAKVTELLCYTLECLFSPEQTYTIDNQLSHRRSKVIIQTLQQLNNNLATPPTLDELAEQANVSRNTLSRLFKASYGQSISEYLLQKRMASAQEMLKTGKYSVLDVSLEVGYDDSSSFGRAYKRYFNHSPKEDKPH